MKHYTDYISVDLAEKLKAAGMPMMPCLNVRQTGSFSDDGGIHFFHTPTYAEIFDWQMERGVNMEHSTDPLFVVWDKDVGPLAFKGKTWHEAANKAIEKALTLI